MPNKYNPIIKTKPSNNQNDTEFYLNPGYVTRVIIQLKTSHRIFKQTSYQYWGNLLQY
jgi:hypothetical protein